MRFANIKSTSLALCLGLVTACSGATDKSEQAPAPQSQQPTAEEAAMAKEYANLPASVVIRVPVDANGNEVSDQAEMRTSVASAEVSNNNTEALFTSAQPARTVSNADELDSDSSTQSWQDPGSSESFDSGYSALNNNQSGYGNQEFGYGQGHGSGGCGGSSWCGYGPRSYSLTFTAAYWSYPRPRCYGFGGYNYYWYPRPSCSPWRWCGGGF